MAFIPVPNVAHVLIQGDVDGQECDNDLYFVHTTGAIAASDLSNLALGIGTWWAGGMLSILNEAYTFRRTRARDLTTAVGFVVESSFTPTPGGVSGEAAPNNCTMSISFRTAFAGRNFRGRNYVPCLTNAEVTGNHIGSTFIGDCITQYSELISGGGSTPAGWTWVVVSRFLNNLPRTTGVFNEIFSVIVVDDIVDSQRRRLPGRGK